jgi:alginate O-acetyltransferase complex protein AlgI
MLFNSAQFAVFFPVVTILYFATPGPRRWITLLLASCVFYTAFIPIYLVVLLGLIVVDYVAGLMIESAVGSRRRYILIASLVSNICVLSVFKYYNFFIDNLNIGAHVLGLSLSLPILAMVLPIGLSFHTFQSMAYTIEVYQGNQKAERHLGIYALYVMFYPQLVAGPIERPQKLLHQFRELHGFDPDRIASGLKLMAWGFFKKLVISDRLAALVNPVFANPWLYHGASLRMATFFFVWQVYCDFSGYSDIAVGAAEVMGFKMTTNFRRPLLARSVRDLWARWHISLSSWFRDYVYIPLGGNRGGRCRWIVNVMVTFLISGLWHGASWRYVLWGALSGLWFTASVLSENFRKTVRQFSGLDRSPALLHALQIGMTFSLFALTLVVFRSPSLKAALYVFRQLASFRGPGLDEMSVRSFPIWAGSILVIALACFEAWQDDDDPRRVLSSAPAWIRWCAYYGLVTIVLALGAFLQTQFMYFQF